MAAAQKWRIGVKMHLACNEKGSTQQPPCKPTMRRLMLSIGG
jgi:hypothetical protein